MCPACGHGEERPWIRRASVPVMQNLPLADEAAARSVPRGELDLVLCVRCGHAWNRAFEPALVAYAPGYENTQTASPAFVEHMRGRARALAASAGIAGRTVLELGCGRGEFLGMLAREGAARAFGWDPSWDGAAADLEPGVEIHRSVWDGELPRDVAAVVCRHVIEHLERPAELVASVARATRDHPGLVLALETPRLEWIVAEEAFWDLFYEHVGYFGDRSLARMVRDAGFAAGAPDVVFGGQYQWLESRPRGGPAVARDEPVDLDPYFRFAERSRQRALAWRGFLRRRSGRFAVWGAGAKGATFLDVVGATPEVVPVVVDLNPRKQGRHVAGTAQRVIAPAELAAHALEGVVVMNPNYAGEVRASLAALGLELEVLDASAEPSARS